MARQETQSVDFVKRFEELKKQWFAKREKQFDIDGDEIYSAVPDRSLLAKMFENMGCDIPLHPSDPPKLIGPAE